MLGCCVRRGNATGRARRFPARARLLSAGSRVDHRHGIDDSGPALADRTGEQMVTASRKQPATVAAPYAAVRDLVLANRILAHEGILDAFGHVSVRHPVNPQHYLISR